MNPLRCLARLVFHPFMHLPGKSAQGPVRQLTSAELQVQERLERHVFRLAGEIGERTAAKGLPEAERYIIDCLAPLGLKIYPHTFMAGNSAQHNVIATLAGADPRMRSVVVGAHYDTVAGSPGANDNASGVAILLELARRLARERVDFSIEFAAFANEEHTGLPPETMGSYHYAGLCREEGKEVLALSLEMLGCFKDEPGTQRYPFPLSLAYPDTANFLGFVADRRSKTLLRLCAEIFRAHAEIPSEGIAAPSWFPNIGRSDHWGFWCADYPAVMITDTAEFRSPLYHTSEDKPQTLRYDRMTLLVEPLAQMILALASDARTAKRNIWRGR